MITRLHLLSTILSFLTFTASASAKQPNLLLIVADDMGYGDLSSYGSKQISTPNLDRLAKNGIRCTDGYVSGSVCAPSRAGLLTGRYGSRFGFEHNLHHPEHVKPEYAGIPLDEPLISNRLKDLGYRTGMVGKWHLGEALPAQHPHKRGFDFFFGMLGGGHNYFPTLDKNKLIYNGTPPTKIRTPYLTDWFTLEAIDFISAKGKATSTETDKPWFLYLSYNTPHSPMQAKDEDIQKFAHIHHKIRRTYCAMQHCMDQNIGKIITHLEQTKQLDNTLICFISDNGGSVEVSKAVNAPLRGTKGTFLEGGIRVPTIYHWPNKLKAGMTYSKPVISLDIQSTFIAAGGGTPPTPGERSKRKGRNKKNGPIYDGVDLLPYLNGEKEDLPHQKLYWRTCLRGSAMRDGDWKLVRPASGTAQLYNLADDISETNNLIFQKPEIARKMIDEFVQWTVSLERNPIFMSAPFWNGYNQKLYQKTYSLVQPEPDAKEDIWKF